MQESLCTIVNPKGLHARAAAEVVKLVEQFDAKVTVEFDGKQAEADSLLHLLTLAANCGKQVKISAQGNDELKVIAALEQLIKIGFYEL